MNTPYSQLRDAKVDIPKLIQNNWVRANCSPETLTNQKKKEKQKLTNYDYKNQSFRIKRIEYSVKEHYRYKAQTHCRNANCYWGRFRIATTFNNPFKFVLFRFEWGYKLPELKRMAKTRHGKQDEQLHFWCLFFKL